MITPLAVPGWCRVRRGGSALLLVAPHGGARQTARPLGRHVKVNDLHTAALAEELATALDAGMVANAVLDRNQLDLNRVSQVARDAPWFPSLLEALIAEILSRHERAEVVFLHGWNTGQAKCDIGIGHALRDECDAPAHAAALTVSPAYVATRLAALRAACTARGIATPFGERYPARHANNVLQLFRRRLHPQAAALAPRLGNWAAAGRVEAVQLELGTPLRWPGPLRAAFGAALHDAFAAPARSPHPAGAEPEPTAPARTVASLHVYDPRAAIGLSARVGPAGDDGRVGSRLLLYLGPRQVALFTGDDPHPAVAGDGPRFAPVGDGLRLTFDGWALRTDDGGRYIDLELALAASHLLAVRADLVFTREHGDHGRVRGTLALDGSARPIDGVGYAPTGGDARPGAPAWRSHLTLHAAVAGGTVALHHRVPGGTLVRDGDAAAPRRVAGLSVTFAGDPHTPRRIVVADAAGQLVAAPVARLAIVRPVPSGRQARVTFGVARVWRAAAAGFGFYEYARVV